MIILILPSWYVSSYNKLSGVFFKEQAEAIAKHKEIRKVIVFAINIIRLKDIVNKKKLDIGYKYKVVNNVHTYTLNLLYLPKVSNWLRFLLGKYLLNKILINEQKINVIHLHSFFNGDLAIWLNKKFKLPYVVTEHTTYFSRDKLSKKQLNYAKNVFKNSKLNIAVSNEFKKLLEGKFGLPFKYIPNIVSSEFLYTGKRSLNNFQFINVGFLDKKKNQDMLIKAFNKAFKEEENVKLLIVGDGGEFENLQGLINESNSSDRIHLFGRASREQIKKLLITSKAFVLASKYETFGVVLIEAMLSGLPVVSTKCGGPESIIKDETLGVLTEINEDSLAKGMKKLYDNHYKYNSKNIISYVKNNFSEEVVVKGLVGIYKNLLTCK